LPATTLYLKRRIAMPKILVIVSILAVALFSTTAFAAVSNDEVTSIKLKEADGTSGQDTNSGRIRL
jgi:hypothetical protein